MEDLTFFGKIDYLWKTIVHSKEIKFIIPIISIILLTIIIASFFKNKKIKRLYFIMYLAIVATLFIIYYNPIINMLTVLFQKLIDYVLFPNLMLYLIMIIISNVILIATVINNNLNRFVKSVNFILFTFMQVLLFFIIKHVISNNIDITIKLTMDNYPQLLVLVETSIFIFALWGLFLLVTKLIMNVKDYREVKEMEFKYNLDIENDEDDFSKDELIEYVPVKKVQ
ncbi:MAG: hypothetical protein J6X02_00710 [Bacilli bacterium]|nr:hypothetical protein [Bacilli bacterium]